MLEGRQPTGLWEEGNIEKERKQVWESLGFEHEHS